MTTVWTPDFQIMVDDWDATPYCVSWKLHETEDAISTLTVVLGNPDGNLSGLVHTESPISIRHGYYNGPMSPVCSMTIKDKTESFPTRHPSTITLVGMDCTERLVGSVLSGNFDKGVQYVAQIEAMLKAAKINGEVNLKNPSTQPEKGSIHNMTPHAAIRWMFGMMDCMNAPAAAGKSPISKDSQPTLQNPKSFEGKIDNNKAAAELDAFFKDIPQFRANQLQNRAGNRVLVAHLDCAAIPSIQAHKSVTVQNVGSEANGDWYVKECTTHWAVNSEYLQHLGLIRPTLGKDGGVIPQPAIMYAKIYEPNTAWVGCREINAPSQFTFVFGQPDAGDAGTQQLVDFTWSVKIQRGRGGGERAAVKGTKINERSSMLMEDYSKNPPQAETKSSAVPPDISSVSV